MYPSLIKSTEAADEKLTKQPSSHHTSSDESLQTASNWLQECLHEHEACNRDIPVNPWHPTRLLDLASFHQHNDTIRLVTTAEDPILAPYATQPLLGRCEFPTAYKSKPAEFQHWDLLDGLAKNIPRGHLCGETTRHPLPLDRLALYNARQRRSY
jgi:hypothetical protein